MLETRFREYALSGAVLLLFHFVLFAITDAFWDTSILVTGKEFVAAVFTASSKGFENFLTVALGGLLFAGVFVLGVFVDQLNALHFAWEMGRFEVRFLRHQWIAGLLEKHQVFLGINAKEILTTRPRANPRILSIWQTSRFKVWKYPLAMFSREQTIYEKETRRRLQAYSRVLDFMLVYVLANKSSSENASHILGLIERWRMCRTLGTIIFICGIEHAAFVFHHFFVKDVNLENPFRLIFLSTGPMLVVFGIALLPVLRSFLRLLDALFPAIYMLSAPVASEAK